LAVPAFPYDPFDFNILNNADNSPLDVSGMSTKASGQDYGVEMDFDIVDWSGGMHDDLILDKDDFIIPSGAETTFKFFASSLNDDNDEEEAWHFILEASNFSSRIVTGEVVPEPSTMLLLGSGLIGLAVLGRKKFRK
jgi:hypothetical protein